MGSLQRHYALRPAPLALLYLLLPSLLTLYVLARLSVGMIWQIGTGLLVLSACLYLALRDVLLRLGTSCVAFRLEKESSITLMLKEGTHLSGVLADDTLVTPFFLVLVIRQEGRCSRHVWLTPGSLEGDAFRRLRVVLRWGQAG